MYKPLRGLLLLVHVINDLTYVLDKVLRASSFPIHASNDFIFIVHVQTFKRIFFFPVLLIMNSFA